MVSRFRTGSEFRLRWAENFSEKWSVYYLHLVSCRRVRNIFVVIAQPLVSSLGVMRTISLVPKQLAILSLVYRIRIDRKIQLIN